MAIPWLLTLLGLAGVAAGVYLGHARVLSALLAAAGGGLLFGISLFWLIPEIGLTTGRWLALALALLAAAMMAVLDRLLLHAGHSPRQGILWPVLAAMALHSFLDGWSVRALAARPLPEIAAPMGLALHKIPEGIAAGWIARRSTSSGWKAAAAGGAAQLATVAGALIEPGADRLGTARFGEGWPAAVVAIIAGSFLFLGFHAVLPHWKKASVLAVFGATVLLVASAGFLH
jgi:zinc transporter ZupT